jgi:hypothetical protein
MKLLSGRPLQIVGLLVLIYACGSKTPTAPIAVPTPVPTPTPTPTPALGNGFGCGLSAMPECGRDEGPPGVFGCCRNEPGARNGQWDAELWDAINILKNEQPDLFNGDNIKDRVRYMNGVAAIAERKYKLCVKPGGPGDEVGVKVSNTYSEQYDIYQSAGRVRYPGYQVTCRPARF